MQWVLLNADQISGTDNATIKLAMSPDGRNNNRGASVRWGESHLRPVDCDALPAEPNPRPRICLYADDTRETREVYSLVVSSPYRCCGVQPDLKVTVGGREITVQLQVESIGNYHAQQAWNGLFMSGRWKCPSRSCRRRSTATSQPSAPRSRRRSRRRFLAS